MDMENENICCYETNRLICEKVSLPGFRVYLKKIICGKMSLARMIMMSTCNDEYLQAHTEHVPHLAGECRLPESISHEFTHHEFQFTKVSKCLV